MKPSKTITHHFDVVKKEPVCENEQVSLVFCESTDVKQEYHIKEEINVAWDERDNNFGLNKVYPIVLMERLSDDIVNKYLTNDQDENRFSMPHQKKRNTNRFSKYYQRFYPKCKKEVPGKQNDDQMCTECGTPCYYECKKCCKRVLTRGGISNHLKSNCLKKGYYFACFKCPYKSISKRNVRNHLHKVHSILHAYNRIEKVMSENVQHDIISTTEHKCTKCEKPFRSLQTVLRHFQVCGQVKANADFHNVAVTANCVQNKCILYCMKCNKKVKHEKVGRFREKKCQNCRSKLYFKCKQCDKIFQSYFGISLHLKAKHTEDKFKCPECDFETTSTNYLGKHVRSMHIIENHECPKCGGTYRNRDALNTHLRICKKEPIFQCDHCSYQCKSKQNLRDHIFTQHIREYLQCKSCPYKSKSKLRYSSHIKTFHSDLRKESLRCRYCRRFLTSKSNLTSHITRMHLTDTSDRKTSYFHCNDCTYKTRYKNDLAKHHRRHLEDNVKECPKCKMQFRYLKRHVESCGKILWCNLCKYRTETKDNLITHIANQHPDRKGIDCPRCGRSYKNRRILNCHLRRCGVDPYFQCDDCSYQTNIKGNLRRHMKTIHLKFKK